MLKCAVCQRTQEETQVQFCSKYGDYLCSKHKNQFLRHGRFTDFDEPHKCHVCGEEKGKIHWCEKAGCFLCYKHRAQFLRVGHFLEKTKRDKNEIVLKPDHAEICLRNKDGEICSKALIDLDDVNRCRELIWTDSGIRGYTHYASGIRDGKKIFLHQFILGHSPGLIIDHINRNGLDNRKRNLRFVTCSENCVNTRTRSSTGEKNIYPKYSGFQVQIIRNSKLVFVKTLPSLEEAVIARDSFLRQYNLEHHRCV